MTPLRTARSTALAMTLTGLGLVAASQPATAARYPEYSLALDLGSEATYGNAVSFHWRWFEMSELHGGIGYNSSGAKLGVGHSFIYNFNRAFGFTLTNALVYSGGKEDEVEVDAEFTPEGSSEPVAITAVKSYDLSPAVLAGFAVGGFWDYLKYLRLTAQACYNFALSGNEVTLGKRITYNEDVDVSNDQEFNEEFDRKAKDVVRAGGLGFSVGAAFIF